MSHSESAYQQLLNRYQRAQQQALLSLQGESLC